jgi:hypothetical protein
LRCPAPAASISNNLAILGRPPEQKINHPSRKSG